MSDLSLFPHQRLDWEISDLEEKSKRSSGNTTNLLKLMKAYLSKGLFHNGGEQACSSALHVGNKILLEEPDNIDALGLIALALVGMERQQQAEKYLERALKITDKNVYVQIALSSCAQAEYKIKSVLQHLKKAVRLAPKSWEIHLHLGRIYLSIAEQNEKKANKRVASQTLFHLIQALLSNPFLEKEASFLKNIGLACLLNGRFKEAERYFSRLKQRQRDEIDSRYYMGLVAFELGKYNNAGNHFRAFLAKNKDRADVMVKMATCFYRLGEYSRAKDIAHECLMHQDSNLEARLLLGKSILALGETGDALRVFRETLVNYPGHLESFSEIVQIRRMEGDYTWLSKALCSEVEQYGIQYSNISQDFSQLIRQRIGVILNEMMIVGDELLPEILKAVNYSQDENMRFALWEVACLMAEDAVARKCEEKIEMIGLSYSLKLGEILLAVGNRLSEDQLIQALYVTEADIRKAAIDRYPPAHDVKQHRQNEEKQKNIARGYKALALLTLATKKSPKARRFLLEFKAQTEQKEDKLLSNIALLLLGDVQSFEELEKQAKSIDRKRIINKIREGLQKPTNFTFPREFISQTEHCILCKKQGRDIQHFLQSSKGYICNQCVSKSQQANKSKDDASCVFCSQNFVRIHKMRSYMEADICLDCYDYSQMLLENNHIENYFRAIQQGFGR